MGFGVRETPGPNRGIPLAKFSAGVAVRLSLRSGAGVTPAEIRRGDPRPAPVCVDTYHGLTERTDARRSGQVRALPERRAEPRHSAGCILTFPPPIARVRVGHA